MEPDAPSFTHIEHTSHEQPHHYFHTQKSKENTTINQNSSTSPINSDQPEQSTASIPIEQQDTQLVPTPHIAEDKKGAGSDSKRGSFLQPAFDIVQMATHLMPAHHTQAKQALISQKGHIDPPKAVVFIVLACIIVFQTLVRGSTQFSGPQGWNHVLYSSQTDPANNAALLALTHPSSTSGAKTTAKMTPQQYINLIVSKMSTDEKIGQMMMVQFVGPTYSGDLDTMITQDHVGSVLLFAANGNIVGKTQLKNLIQKIQAASTLPMGISLDQEGGAVDRLKALDGPEPAAATIGQTNDPHQAQALGTQVANALASYGININLAPVIDVDNDPGSELHTDLRTYGTNAATVTKMAEAYLQGLQKSHEVVGTLKHFPGLGDVSVDPHFGLPTLKRTRSQIESIDWAPYHALIKSGQVHAIMVTHEIVPALDPTTPASLSSKLVAGILRDEMGFQGVIMTDSLTMDSISKFYTPGGAAADAIIAGSDIIMGANSADDAATMISGIKEAMTEGTITQARIDQSVKRILMMKYQLGLLSIPAK